MRGARKTLHDSMIRALAYPRELVQDAIPIHDCPHSGLYAAEDPRCRECMQKLECEWLYDNAEFAALETKPTTELLRALEFALEYVLAYIAYWNHDSRRCACPSCSWFTASLQLFDQVREDTRERN